MASGKLPGRLISQPLQERLSTPRHLLTCKNDKVTRIFNSDVRQADESSIAKLRRDQIIPKSNPLPIYYRLHAAI